MYCGILVQFAAQSTGVLVVNNYQVLLYNNLGLYGWLPLLLYAVYTSWAAFLNWINALLLDRVGRRPVIIIGLSGCILMISIYTAMVASFAGGPNRAGNAMGKLISKSIVVFWSNCFLQGCYFYSSSSRSTGALKMPAVTSTAARSFPQGSERKDLEQPSSRCSRVLCCILRWLRWLSPRLDGSTVSTSFEIHGDTNLASR
jgi:MFS family permease